MELFLRFHNNLSAVFCIAAIPHWNRLRMNLKSIKNVSQFKIKLFSHLKTSLISNVNF